MTTAVTAEEMNPTLQVFHLDPDNRGDQRMPLLVHVHYICRPSQRMAARHSLYLWRQGHWYRTMI